MDINNLNTSKLYWEKNIGKFSNFYTKNSDEDLKNKGIFSLIYKCIGFPIERKYMKVRYNIVQSFIFEMINKDTVVADVGCGCGIFTEMALSLGAKVYALDFAQNALKLTKQRNSMHDANALTLRLFDLIDEAVPKVDVILAIGILPYIESIDIFLRNTLPSTNIIMFNFLNASNPLNKLRRKLPFLDVRGYHYHSLQMISKKMAEFGFCTINRIKLATGTVLVAKRF